MVKKAYRQRRWSGGKWRIELSVVSQLTQVMGEAIQAVFTNPETEEKRGVPPQNPNVRNVVKGLIDLGEFDRLEDCEGKEL